MAVRLWILNRLAICLSFAVHNQEKTANSKWKSERDPRYLWTETPLLLCSLWAVVSVSGVSKEHDIRDDPCRACLYHLFWARLSTVVSLIRNCWLSFTGEVESFGLLLHRPRHRQTFASSLSVSIFPFLIPASLFLFLSYSPGHRKEDDRYPSLPMCLLFLSSLWRHIGWEMTRIPLPTSPNLSFLTGARMESWPAHNQWRTIIVWSFVRHCWAGTFLFRLEAHFFLLVSPRDQEKGGTFLG